MQWGYARASTNENKQDINRQIRELKAAGAEEVVFEYEHGDAKVKASEESFVSLIIVDGDGKVALGRDELTV